MLEEFFGCFFSGNSTIEMVQKHIWMQSYLIYN